MKKLNNLELNSSQINFINTKDFKKNQKLKKYVTLSIILSIIIIAVLTIITVIQKNRLNEIKKNIINSQIAASTIKTTQTQSVQPVMQSEQSAKLKSEQIELKTQLLEIDNLKKTPKKETSILLNIYKIVAKQLNVHELSINKSEFILLAENPDDKIANKITKRLSKLQHIKTANLESIQKNNNKFVFKIKGEIK